MNERSAGVLLSITSLPSAFGIGDIGPEAKAFADFLSRSGQTYWQLLPLNPPEAGLGRSPYSSTSSMAGSTLLISPEWLADEGLLDAKKLAQYHLDTGDRVDYIEAEQVKNGLFEEAYRTFLANPPAALKKQFSQFCKQEAAWLNDFVLFMVLKKQFEDKPWYAWPDEYKLRKAKALKQFANDNPEAIEREKWLQFIFARQWRELREYCNKLNVKLFGDLPFYVSYDSADVWANPSIFSLDKNGKLTGVAGVPPDYFNSNGQLWGMPVFRWDVLKEQKYDWWVQRIRKNMELFDLLRLDHFRAFADFWEVPADEETAINGQWKLGPGADLFNRIQEELGELPLIAEDLGDIGEDVYQLRDAFKMPGMKVVQFAFGDGMPESEHIPHHYTPSFVAYTGTHDNNTVKGWYRKDAGRDGQKRLKQYLGKSVSEKTVHLEMGRMVYACVAKIAILPMQDVLGLDETARMNTPSSTSGNWLWRLQLGQITPAIEQLLNEWVTLYDRRG